MSTPKYQFHVLTWGGFYNDEYKEHHGLADGDFVFDTMRERTEFIDERKKIEKYLNTQGLCFSFSEGFCCNVRTVLHRVIEFQGIQYYSHNDLGVNYSFSSAARFMENNWYPGFNDYPIPFGDDFDYETADIKIVKKWITGAFQEIDDCL
jgi:hypothetical protein